VTPWPSWHLHPPQATAVVPGSTPLPSLATNWQSCHRPKRRSLHWGLGKLGLGHASDWVNEWIVGNEKAYTTRGDSRQTVTVQPEGPGRGAGSTMLDVLNEVGHAVWASRRAAAVCTRHTQTWRSPARATASDRQAASPQRRPRLARTTLAFLKTCWRTPFDQAEFGGIITTSDRAPQELFAQLWAMYTFPALRGTLKM